jgi:PAS domain S-box-containing protein
MRLVLKDGTIKYIEGKTEVLSDEDNKPYKLLGTCQDITEHYLLNERLKENEEASSQLINSAPEGIIVIDQNANILRWNPKAAEIFGWSQEEIVGTNVMDTIIPEHFLQEHEALQHFLKTNISEEILNKTVEVKALKKGGTQIYIALNISFSHQKGKEVYIAFIRDISEEKAIALMLEEQRNQLAMQNRALERTNQELVAFNYISSHDLKEPVRKIKIFGNLLNSNTAEPLLPQQQDYLDRITSAADHMERLIEALVVFSKTDTAERQFEFVPLNKVVADISELMSDRIKESKAEIIKGELPDLWAEPFQIQQLFENIIGNALKYSRPDRPPRIIITTVLITGKEIIHLGADPETSYYHVSVADNGIGFDQRYATKIFEVFQRLHGKDSYSGTGIGLAICKKIVQNHDGFITAQSQPNQGSTFHIYLPNEKRD